MTAPAKFLFDVDFAAGAEREPMITLAEHAGEAAETETAAHRRGYAEAQNDAAVEPPGAVSPKPLSGSPSVSAEATKALHGDRSPARM